MEIFYTKKFLKELSKIPSKERKNIEFFSFETLPNIDSLRELSNVTKLRIDPYYRARFGDYRVGMELRSGVLTLKRVLHRSEIYKQFP